MTAELSAVVAAGVDRVADRALVILAEWGHGVACTS
jgi:hypothetical protein